MKEKIAKRVGAFDWLLDDLLKIGKLESQFMISMVEDISVTLDELHENGCDYTDQTTRDTWGGMIYGQCSQMLDAFKPRHRVDLLALRAIIKESKAISELMDAAFKKYGHG